MKVEIINRSKHQLPAYETEQSAGMDLRANLENPVNLGPLERKLIPTGIYLALPPNAEAQVRPRSGLAYKQGLTVLNAPGTIDADYRGEVGVILVNLSNTTVTISDGDRVAQLVVAPMVQAEWVEVETLDDTARGAGGFGSTGKN